MFYLSRYHVVVQSSEVNCGCRFPHTCFHPNRRPVMNALYSRPVGLLHAKELGQEPGRNMTSKSVEKREVEVDAMGGSLISRWTRIAGVVAFYWLEHN